MNKCLFILLCILCLNINGFNQEIKGKIINTITKEPLPLSTIIIKNDKYSGAYANESGEFTIKQKLEKDTLLISCIGYFNKEISLNDYLQLNNKIIELMPYEIKLPDYIVKNINSTPKEIGFHKLNKNLIQTGRKGEIIIVKIPNEAETIYHKIISLNFNFSSTSESNEKHNKGIVRVRLYDCDSNTNEPSINLLSKDIFLTIPKLILPWSKKLIKVDISEYNIEFPSNGIFLGIEWIGEQNNNLYFNINPAICYSSEVNEYSSRVSFFGRKFINAFDGNNKQVPMFGITIK
jgi:CarboxypepD_reg-like domain